MNNPTLYGLLKRMLDAKAGIIDTEGNIVEPDSFNIVDKRGRLVPPPVFGAATFAVTYNLNEPLPGLYTDFLKKEGIDHAGIALYNNLRLRRADGAEYECDVHEVSLVLKADRLLAKNDLPRFLLGSFAIASPGLFGEDIYRIPVVAPEDHVGLEEFLTGAGVQLEKWPTPWFCPVREPPARKYEKYRPEITLYDLVHMARKNVDGWSEEKSSCLITSDCRVLGRQYNIRTLFPDGDGWALATPEPGTVSAALIYTEELGEVPRPLLNYLRGEGAKLIEEKTCSYLEELWLKRSDGEEIKVMYNNVYLEADVGEAEKALAALGSYPDEEKVEGGWTERRPKTVNWHIYYFQPADYWEVERFLLEAGIGIKERSPPWFPIKGAGHSSRRPGRKETPFFGYT